MRLCLLVLLAGVLPLLWGWAVHWLLKRIWPEPSVAWDASGRHQPTPATPFDYQI